MKALKITTFSIRRVFEKLKMIQLSNLLHKYTSVHWNCTYLEQINMNYITLKKNNYVCIKFEIS